MLEFIRKANIAAFRKQLLEKSMKGDRRRTLLRLLAEEKAKAPASEPDSED